MEYAQIKRKKGLQILSACAGAAVSFLLASFLHYAFRLTGGSTFVAIFAAANESVWEHVKILLIPYLLWSIPEYYIIKPDKKRFISARAAGALTLMALTVCFFFVYSGIWGSSVLWIDIAGALLWLTAAEFSCLRILNGANRSEELFPVAAAFICLLAVMLLCFTVSPPKIGLFRDPVTLLYGLETMP